MYETFGGGDLLHHVLFHGGTVTGFPLEVSSKEVSLAFMLGVCSPYLSLIVTSLSLAFAKSYQNKLLTGLIPLWVANHSHDVVFCRPIYSVH